MPPLGANLVKVIIDLDALVERGRLSVLEAVHIGWGGGGRFGAGQRDTVHCEDG